MERIKQDSMDRLYSRAEPEFEGWEKLKDLTDEMIDLMLNYRQSGHPGGSRSKVHAMLATMLSGAMRWATQRLVWPRVSSAGASRGVTGIGRFS